MAGRRAAEWRFPTPKQAKADETRRLMAGQAAPARTDEECWWASVLADPRAETARPSPSRRLGEIQAGELRVDCSRCFKIVRELRRDMIARFGAEASWRDVGQRLLNERCEIRTGRHEEDGCWPDFR